MAGEYDFDPSGNTRAFSPPVSGGMPGTVDENFDPADHTRPILGTAFQKVPTRENPNGSVWRAVDNAAADYQQSAAQGSRIVDAAKEGWENRPQVWTDAGRDALNHPLAGAPEPVRRLLEPSAQMLTRGIIQPVGDAASLLLGAGGAALRGGQQAVVEAGRDLGRVPGLGEGGLNVPRLARDVAAFPEAFPPTVGDPALQRPLHGYPEYQGANTSLGGKGVYGNWIKVADADNTVLKPRVVGEALDLAQPKDARTAARTTTTGNGPVEATLKRLEEFRNKPMTVQEWQGVNEGLSALIREQTDPILGLKPDGVRLQQIQIALRDRINNATQDDLQSGTGAGLEAIKQGNAAYSQAKKMEAVERMLAASDADLTDNPTTAFRSKVRAFINNEGKVRGWTDDELAALKEAADRGALGNVVHAMGTRLMPRIMGAGAAVTGLGHGMGPIESGIVGMGANVAGHAMGAPFRALGNSMMNQRVRNALDILGQRVPPNPLNIPEAAPPPAAPPPAPPRPAFNRSPLLMGP